MKAPKELRKAINRLRKFSPHKNGVLKWHLLERFELKMAKNKRLKKRTDSARLSALELT